MSCGEGCCRHVSQHQAGCPECEASVQNNQSIQSAGLYTIDAYGMPEFLKRPPPHKINLPKSEKPQ